MTQVRSELRKQAKSKRLEKATELQCALEDRAAARRLTQELAELERGSIRWAARFRVQVKPQTPQTRTSPVVKRPTISAGRKASSPAITPRLASSWAVDDAGMRGVSWQQSYFGRNSQRFYRGAARDKWEYDVRDEAVLLDASGEPVIISNMGDDWVEIGAAWQAMEDASTRKNAKIQICAIAPFDSDMSREEMIVALTHFCETVLGPLELPYSAVIHAPPEGGDQRNVHPHLAFSLRPMRRVEPYCWEVADEVRGELDGRDGVQMLRHLWAHSMSEAADRAGRNMRYTGLGYGARGLPLESGEHLGEARAAIVARGGHVWAHERNRIKNERNSSRRLIRDADRKIAVLTAIRDAALARIAADNDYVRPAKLLAVAGPVPAARVQQVAELIKPALFLQRKKVRKSSFLLQSADPKPAMRLNASTAPDVLATASRCLAGAASPKPAMLLKQSPVVTPAECRQVHGAFSYDPARRLTGSTVPTAAMFLQTPKPLLPRIDLVQSLPVGNGPDPLHLEWMRALDRARARRDLKRKERSTRQGRTGIHEVRTIDDVPARELLEAHPLMPEAAIRKMVVAEDDARIERLRLIDPYVADYGGGQLEIVLQAMKAVGAGDEWMGRLGVQRALAAMRAEQQRVVLAITDEAARRPLAFAKAGTRFWPSDLDADHLRRLDRWAADPGFQQDVFPVEQWIYKAHSARDEAQRQAVVSSRALGASPASAAQLKLPISDGFGGLRNTLPPTFVRSHAGLHINALDPVTGAPSQSLLMLLNYSGKHPHQLAFADDGRLTTLLGTSKLIEPLVSLWRDDNRVQALVVRTVAASRSAGRPVWPEEHAAAIRAVQGSPKLEPNRHPHDSGIEG